MLHRIPREVIPIARSLVWYRERGLCPNCGDTTFDIWNEHNCASDILGISVAKTAYCECENCYTAHYFEIDRDYALVCVHCRNGRCPSSP